MNVPPSYQNSVKNIMNVPPSYQNSVKYIIRTDPTYARIAVTSSLVAFEVISAIIILAFIIYWLLPDSFDVDTDISIFNDIIDAFNYIKDKISRLGEMIKKPIDETKRKLNDLARNLRLPIPSVTVPAIPYAQMSCNVSTRSIPVVKDIPGLNHSNIDPCAQVTKPFNDSVYLVNKQLNEINELIDDALAVVPNEFKKILEELKEQVARYMDDIKRPWLEVKDELEELRDDIKNVIDMIRNFAFRELLKHLIPYAIIVAIILAIIGISIVSSYASLLLLLYNVNDMFVRMIL